jgi:hypothetical protein
MDEREDVKRCRRSPFSTRPIPPAECHCLVDIPHQAGEIAECITPPGGQL